MLAVILNSLETYIVNSQDPHKCWQSCKHFETLDNASEGEVGKNRSKGLKIKLVLIAPI